jgi:hypothetical protein
MATPLIGHDGKKRTVTFGSDGEGPTEGAYRTARLYSRISTATFGASAAILTLVSMWLMVDFASDLAATWAQVVKFSIIAIAISLATTGLPVGAGLLAHSNPRESQLMMQTWVGLLAIAGLAMLFFVLRLDGAARPYSPAANARAAELRDGLQHLQSPDWALWSTTGECQRPGRDKAAACAALLQRRQDERDELAAIDAGVWSEGWTPGALIGTGRVAAVSDALRRLFAGLLALVAMAGAGIFARWGTISHAEAFRQADGIVAPPPAAAPSVSAGGPPALVSPLETTELWFQGRVLPDPNGRLSPSAAYLDYEAACQVNGLPPMSSGAFYNLLAAKAKASGGAITRVKIGGIHHYAGWALATADLGQVSAEGGEMLALPYRS